MTNGVTVAKQRLSGLNVCFSLIRFLGVHHFSLFASQVSVGLPSATEGDTVSMARYFTLFIPLNVPSD